MADIIHFPKGKGNNPPQSLNDILSSVEDIQNEHIEFLLESMVDGFIARLHDEGFNIQNENATVPLAFVGEAMRAAMLATHNREHELHQFAVDYYNKANNDNESD